VVEREATGTTLASKIQKVVVSGLYIDPAYDLIDDPEDAGYVIYVDLNNRTGATNPAVVSVPPIAAGTYDAVWYRNTRPSVTGGTPITSQTTGTLSLTAGADVIPKDANGVEISGTYYYYCIVTDTNSSLTPKPTAVTKIQKVVASWVRIDTDLDDGVLKLSLAGPPAAYIAIVTEPVSTGLTYQWYWNTSASTVGATKVAGQTLTGIGLVPATLPTAVGTYYYFCVVTHTTSKESVTSNYKKIVLDL